MKQKFYIEVEIDTEKRGSIDALVVYAKCKKQSADSTVDDTPIFFTGRIKNNKFETV